MAEKMTIGELLAQTPAKISVDEAVEPERSDLDKTIERNKDLEDEFRFLESAGEDEDQERINMKLARLAAEERMTGLTGNLNQQLFPVPQVYPEVYEQPEPEPGHDVGIVQEFFPPQVYPQQERQQESPEEISNEIQAASQKIAELQEWVRFLREKQAGMTVATAAASKAEGE